MARLSKQDSFPLLHHNIHLLWASLFIEELVRHGITHFCIAPGSRSTPLTLAVANHSKATAHVHFDERGLGFLALGISQSTQQPVVIITTSGTAVANLYPAIIEAKQSHIPLIVLSADRPPELIDCSANQAINQHKIFADYPVFFSQIPNPNESIDSRFLLTTLNQGLFQQQIHRGPIHFNMAFSEPFYPSAEKIDFYFYLKNLNHWLTNKSVFTSYRNDFSAPEVTTEAINLNAKRVLVVAGRIQNKAQANAIQHFCRQSQSLLFADIQSQLQGTTENTQGYDLLLENTHFHQLIEQADLILQFSDHVISKRLNKLTSQAAAPIWVISEHAHRIDPSHCVSKRFVCSASTFIKQVINQQTIDHNWLTQIAAYQVHFNKLIQSSLTDNKLSEINTTCHLLNQSQQNIVIGNSLPIRLADMFAQTNNRVYTNRGASGIDGLIATAIGIAKEQPLPTCLLIGDISFLYDLNSLILAHQLPLPFVIVLLNNDGGGIFNLLPVPEAQQRQFYQLPHGLTFEQTCAQFSIHYQQPTTLAEFKTQYQQAISTEHHHKQTLIEVCVNNQLTPMQLQHIKNEVKNAII